MKIAIVGFGKIAREQHVPALAHSGDFELSAIAEPRAVVGPPDVPVFPDIDALLHGTKVSAVAVCTMPQARYAIARRALAAGRHVLLEKPPGASVAEVLELAALAAHHRVSLFAAWHSRYAPGVEPARRWLSARRIHRVHVVWKEDVQVWHPGQRWLWEPGGLGVFDPGINALSILGRILPAPLRLVSSELAFPHECHTPIAATLALEMAGEVPILVELDFRGSGTAAHRQRWDILVDTDAGELALSNGGGAMSAAGAAVQVGESREYPALYAHFAALVREARSDVEVMPLQLAADAFLRGRRVEVAGLTD